MDDESDWSQTDSRPQGFVFEEQCGVIAALDADCTEYDCFSLFFSPDIFRHVKTETNRYAASWLNEMKRKGTLKTFSMFNKWSAVKIHEIYKFFAIILHMCLLKLPKLRDYWSTDPLIQTGFARSLMSRDRFLSLLYMLHINDNNNYKKKGEDGHDPLHKVRPFFDFFVESCKKNFKPFANLIVDEGMCPFRGRVGFRIYMKNKPNKYGIKLYILCDSATGYVLNVEIYTGAAVSRDNSIQGLFQRLCIDYFGKGHCFYMDRFYTSPSLLKFLWEQKSYGVGTVMKNRKGLPKCFKTKLKKGQAIFRRNQELLACKWKSNRDVLCLSTQHAARMSTVSVRGKGGPNDIEKPDIILDYNQNKTGVDRADQMYSYYPFQRKTLKWWKKLFFHLFVMAVVNGYIIFKEMRGRKNTLCDFIKAVGKALVEKAGEAEQSQPTPSTSHIRTSARHFPSKIPPTPGKERPQKYCRVCSDKGKKESGKRVRKDSRWWCAECKVGLCVPQCFEIFHTRVNYT